MKKLLFGLLFMLASFSSFGQTALEGVLVDKVNAGSLGTTYRVFVDMAPDWKLQAVFAVTSHQMFFNTTTTFYNHPTFGVTFGGNLIESLIGVDGNVRYDSYLTVSAATSTSLGVPTSVDPDGFVTGTVNSTAFTGDNPNVAFGTTPGTSFSNNTTIYNVTPAGGIAELPGADAQNRVFIGQFTTTGDFSFEINVQLRNTTTVPAVAQQYVARNPVSGGSIPEFESTALRYTSVVVAPTVSITAPANGATYTVGNTVNIAATAADADGSVTKVEFYRNAVSPANKIGEDLSATGGWTLDWTPAAAGSYGLRAVATDNDGNPTTSAVVNITVGTPPANDPPVVSLTAPVSGAPLNLNEAFTLTASASDPDGTVTKVEFYNGATKLGEDLDATGGWTYSWTPAATGNVSLTAVATDNGSASTTSVVVNTYVRNPSAGFAIVDKSAICYESDVFCMTIRADIALVNAIGFDIPLHYDGTKVHPTGVVYVKSGTGTLIGNYNWVSTYVNIVDATNIMNIALAINASAPAGTKFNGSGDLICVEFVKTSGFLSVDNAIFSTAGIDVSYVSGVDRLVVTSDGTFSTTKDENFNGSLKFWKDNSPIAYTLGTNLITSIYGSTDLIGRSTPVTPNAQGNFQYNMVSGLNSVKIDRDIAPTTDVMDVINGADAQLVARVVVNDVAYKPSIFQMLAMDVNRDGLVSSGDLTQIMNRTVQLQGVTEFKQTNNYGNDGNPIAGMGKSKDWVFLPSDTIYAEQFRISTAWPFAEPAPGKGYSRFGLPKADTAQEVKIIGGTCPIVLPRTYLGVMLGDVNGSYATFAISDVLLKSTEMNTVVFDLAKARFADGYAEVPVYYSSDEQVNSLDFALQYNEDGLSLQSVVKRANYLETADNFNASDRTLRFTSYSLKNYESGKELVSVRFRMNSNELKSTDLSSVVAYVNGNPAAVKITDADGLSTETTVNIFPNPASSVINVEVSADAKVVLMDMTGRSILFEADAVANQKQEINISGVADGMYMIKVSNNDFVSLKKVVIKK